jgi:hypothetical protein
MVIAVRQAKPGRFGGLRVAILKFLVHQVAERAVEGSNFLYRSPAERTREL